MCVYVIACLIVAGAARSGGKQCIRDRATCFSEVGNRLQARRAVGMLIEDPKQKSQTDRVEWREALLLKYVLCKEWILFKERSIQERSVA